jgi:hypothetical protein
MSTIKLGGVMVDADDPCALYQALYAAKLRMVAGEQIEETEYRSAVSQSRVRIAPANMAAIDDELMRLSTACQAKTSGKRARFRIVARH